jgi:hypothetical protein
MALQEEMDGEILETEWVYSDRPAPLSKLINPDIDDEIVAPNGEGVFFPKGAWGSGLCL